MFGIATYLFHPYGVRQHKHCVPGKIGYVEVVRVNTAVQDDSIQPFALCAETQKLQAQVPYMVSMFIGQ